MKTRSVMIGGMTQLQTCEDEFPATLEGVERRRTGSVTLVTGDGRVHLSLTDAESELLDRLDGHTSRNELESHFEGDLDELLSDLWSAGLLVGSELAPEPRMALSSAGIEFAGFDRIVASFYRGPGRWLFTKTFLCVATILAVAGLIMTVAQPPLRRPDSVSPTTLILLVVASVGAGVLHELGHALVIHHYGRRVGRAGFGHYWGEIAFFVDASDALFLEKSQRLIQALAGPATDAVLASAVTIAAHVLPDGPWTPLLQLVALGQWIVVAFNLAPILKLDGYWAAADLLDQPDLYAQSGRAVIQLLRGRRDPKTIGLAGYALISAAAGVAAICLTVSIWTNHYFHILGQVWNQGPFGIVAVCLFVTPALSGVITGLVHLTRSLTHRQRMIFEKEVTK